MVVALILLVMVIDTCITAYMISRVRGLSDDLTSCAEVIADITSKQLEHGAGDDE